MKCEGCKRDIDLNREPAYVYEVEDGGVIYLCGGCHNSGNSEQEVIPQINPN